MTVIHQIWWTSIIHIWLASRIQYMHTSYMMDIHLIHKWWTFIIFINDGHPSYSLMMDIHNIWHLSYMTNTLLTGPSLSSKPLQEHKLIIIMELHHYWLSNTLLFIFQIKYTLVKSILLMPKWNFWNPVAKFDIDPKMSLLAKKKSGFQGQKQWPPKFHIKFRNPGPTQYVGHIPKKTIYFWRLPQLKWGKKGIWKSMKPAPLPSHGSSLRVPLTTIQPALFFEPSFLR